MAYLQIMLAAIIGVIVGVISGFLITRRVFVKQQEKNPPIDENIIRIMFRQMGRKPSEAQINTVMEAIRRQQRIKKK